MFINKIDELIDNILEDFYSNIMTKNKIIKDILKDVNYVKFQKDINNIIINYINNLPKDEITIIVKEGNSYNTILNIIKKYIAIYLFLTIGINYSGKDDIFINNMIEFTKSQSQYILKIDDFFNSESNALIIKLYYMTKNIIKLMDNYTSENIIKKEKIKKKPYADDTIEFMNKLDKKVIEMGFNLNSELLNGDEKKQFHIIIKTLIVLLIYRENDKTNLYKMIEEIELNEGEYMFIDIVEPKDNLINFYSIETLMNKEDIKSGIAYDIWDYIEELNVDKKTSINSSEEKINILLNSGYIMPILDDFLLYHKDTEKYDIYTKNKLREDTRAKYIIEKLDKVSNLYNDNDTNNKDKIMKLFNIPLLYRKAVLINNNEDIKIINKFLNQGKRNTKNDNLFNDLGYYKSYSYVNFKNFNSCGFTNYFNKTVSSVRSINFDKTIHFRQKNIYNRLQLRVSPKNTFCNIVGLMIPSNKIPLQCIKIADVINIRKLSNNNNGFKLFLKFLNKSVLEGEIHNSSVYWLFDINKDNIKTKSFETKGYITTQDFIKNMVAHIYDKFIKNIYYSIIDVIDSMDNFNITYLSKIVFYVNKYIFNMGLDSSNEKKLYEDLEKYVFENKIIDFNSDKLIENDLLFGLEGDIINLPQYKNTLHKELNKIRIDLSYIDESGKIIKKDYIDGICQHNISWENVLEIKMKDYNEYMKRLYEFIRQYVIENPYKEMLCKSCGYYVDIQNYISEGRYVENVGYVSYSLHFEINLEDLPEYEKYKFSIKIMDKNIEKIAMSVGLNNYIGNNLSTIWKRKSIIKNTIDMVSINNKLLANIFKNRNEKKTEMYGISKELSSFFIFEMENKIFQISSIDKDQELYKMIKRNNITIYSMIYLILDINETQISFFITDKKNLCDIQIFDRIKNNLFSGLKIKKNNTDDKVNILDYTILCYIIYMISCRIAKYRLWYSSLSNEKNILKMIPIIQKYIVHTTVDIINSILENSFLENAPYIFEIFRVKFYDKLNNLYNNNKYYQLLLKKNTFSYVSARNRIYLKLLPNNVIPKFSYNISNWKTNIPIRFFTKYTNRFEIKYNGISNLTNCLNGKFHKWINNNGYVLCSLCNVRMNMLKYNKEDTDKIIKKYKNDRINIIAQKICLIDKLFHIYVYDEYKGKNICNKCKKPDDYQYSNEELKKIEEIINNVNKIRIDNEIDTINKNNNENNKKKKYIQKVIDKNLDNMKSFPNYIEKFINIISDKIGNEIKGDYPINLKYDTYIIDHDNNGFDLGGKNIIIIDTDNKNTIFHKEKHPFFKTDVIYYIDKTSRRTEVFYDKITHKLLGYKEISKDYVIVNSDKTIKIEYSFFNKIIMLGHTGKYIDIRDKYEDIKKNKNYSTDKIYKIIIDDISRERENNLKNIIIDFQIMINRIKNRYKYSIKEIKDSKEDKFSKMENVKNIDMTEYYFSNLKNKLVNKYINTIVNINLDNNNKHKIFKHWKAMNKGINFNKNNIILNNIINTTLVNYKIIDDYNYNNNHLLFYIINEFYKLIEYNSKNNITNICNFLVEFIDINFRKYNTEHIYVNNEIKRFIYIIRSSEFIRESLDINNILTDGIYDEVVDIEEITDEDIQNKIDSNEQDDALDIDMNEEEQSENFSSTYESYAESYLSRQI